jgi:hypothetical protein
MGFMTPRGRWWRVAGALWLLVVAGLACTGPGPTWQPGDPCQGHIELCDRRYDELAYPTAHNAMANDEDGFVRPNQAFGLTRQLDDGIRAVMLDTHYDEDLAYLCHGLCELGKKPLASGLGEITAFVEAHPGEVVSIVFESDVSEADTEAAMRDSGLLAYARVKEKGTPWPTLAEMLKSGQRVVVFTDDDARTLPWYLYLWDFAGETPFDFRAVEDFSCAQGRGSVENGLFILHHYLTRVTALPSSAEMVNHNPLFLSRAQACQAERGHLPNFVTVDFYSIGDLFPVAGTLNRLP